MHYTRDSFSAFRAPRKAIRYRTNSSRPGHKSFTRTSNITSARLAERDWCIKIQSSLLQIYFRLSGSSPRSYLFTSAKGRSGVHTAPKNGKKNYPICDAPLSRSARRSFARRHRNCASTTVLVCEQKPCPV